MPEMDGFQATEEIRRREGAERRTPVIAMTAGVLEEDRERCVAAGMDDFVPKPVDAGLLSAVLARWVAAPGGEPAAAAAPPGAEPDGPVLDPARLELLRGIGVRDGWGLLPAVVAGFLEDSQVRLAALQAAVRTADREALARTAHNLKGTAANVGAVQVANLCADLEALGRAGDAAGTAPVLDRLEAELQRANAALAGVLPGAS